jgi:transcriptional regulator with XRE-family HTH domain
LNTSTLKRTMGKNVRSLRESKNISIDELAQLMSLSPAFIGLIERGTRGITSFNVKQLTEIFDISADELFKEPRASLSVKEPDFKTSQIEKANILAKKLTLDELNIAINLMSQLYSLRKKEITPEYLDDDEDF